VRGKEDKHWLSPWIDVHPGSRETRESDICTEAAHARVEVLALPLELPTLRSGVCLVPALKYAKVLLYASSLSLLSSTEYAPRTGTTRAHVVECNGW
jgi:hypothetical protein